MSFLRYLTVFGLGGAAAAAASPAVAHFDRHYDRCEYIRATKNLDLLHELVRLHDPCAPQALARLVDLSTVDVPLPRERPDVIVDAS